MLSSEPRAGTGKVQVHHRAILFTQMGLIVGWKNGPFQGMPLPSHSSWSHKTGTLQHSIGPSNQPCCIGSLELNPESGSVVTSVTDVERRKWPLRHRHIHHCAPLTRSGDGRRVFSLPERVPPNLWETLPRREVSIQLKPRPFPKTLSPRSLTL